MIYQIYVDRFYAFSISYFSPFAIRQTLSTLPSAVRKRIVTSSNGIGSGGNRYSFVPSENRALLFRSGVIFSIFLFGGVFYFAVSLSEVFVLGIRGLIRERSLIVKSLKWVGNGCKNLIKFFFARIKNSKIFI